MSRLAALSAGALGVTLVSWMSRGPWPAAACDPPAELTDETEHQADDPLDAIWANAACYVCHTSFVKEELGTVHLKDKVTCVKCHGLSAAHANDEDIGATPPDVVFRRDQIDRMCEECHETHDAPARKVLARFLERRLSLKSPPTCTDCHGRHKIEEAAEKCPAV